MPDCWFVKSLILFHSKKLAINYQQSMALPCPVYLPLKMVIFHEKKGTNKWIYLTIRLNIVVIVISRERHLFVYFSPYIPIFIITGKQSRIKRLE